MKTLKRFAVLHFHIVVWLSIFGSIAVFREPGLILSDEEGLYGPLGNNLLIALGYLLVGQLGLWVFRYVKGGHVEALVMGYTFIATAIGAKVYAEVNGLPISEWFPISLIYVALAHGVYYLTRPAEEPRT